MRLSVIFSLVGLVLSVAPIGARAEKSPAACPETAAPVQRNFGFTDNDILFCTSEKWPGLGPDEFYVTIVTHPAESDDPTVTTTQSRVVNVKTQKIYPAPAPNRYYFFAKDHDYDKINDDLLHRALEQKMTPLRQKYAVQISCDERPLPRLSLYADGEAFQWHIDYVRAGRCHLLEKSESPSFLAADIVIAPSRLALDGAAEPDLKSFNVDIQPRQVFRDGREPRDFLREFVQTTNHVCAFPKDPKLRAQKSPIYETNRWSAPADDSRQTNAVEVNLASLVDPKNSGLALDLFLQEKNGLDQTQVVGQWHISSVFEAKNLIFVEHNKEPKRVVIRDSLCGKEYASNWF